MRKMHNVRDLNFDDIPRVAGWLAALPLMQRYSLTESTARRQLEQALNQGHILLTVDAGDPGCDIACGLAWIMPEGAFGRSAYLRLFGVLPGLHGQGVGGHLLQEAERRVDALGRDLFLLVSDFNTDAQRFYRRHNYAQIGTIPGYVLPDVSELIFWKSHAALQQPLA
jgi:ribosomal protein S18 acetylase RimI-like enzyme